MQTQIDWLDPNDHQPPFDQEILVVFGEYRTDNAGVTWERLARVMNAKIAKIGPGDEVGEEGEEYNAFLAKRDDEKYDNYQFYVLPWGEAAPEDIYLDTDYYSNTILAWAPMPDFSSMFDKK